MIKSSVSFSEKKKKSSTSISEAIVYKSNISAIIKRKALNNFCTGLKGYAIQRNSVNCL